MLHEAKVGSEEECSAGNGNNKTSFLVLNVMYIQNNVFQNIDY